LPRAAVVVEGRYSHVFKLCWPNVPVVFCETRPLAEEWTYRLLARPRLGCHRGRLDRTASAGSSRTRFSP
jgi:hypothetical protein